MITQYKSPGSLYIEFVNETIANGSELSWTFTGTSAYNLIDFQETNETSATVKYMLPSGDIAATDTLTSGTPISVNGYDIIKVEIPNTQGIEATYNGSINIYTTQASIEDTPVTNGVLYWNGVGKYAQTNSGFTFNGTALTIPSLIVGSSTPFADSSGTLTLQNVDALDATTTATIEAAITPNIVNGVALGSATNMTANGSYQTTNHQIAVPSDGDYLISYQVTFNWTPGSSSDGINVRIQNTTQGSTITGSINFMSAYNGTFNRQPTISGTVLAQALTASDNIQIQCSATSGATTFNTLQQVNAETFINYIKLNND